jgi:hypothetical protein
MVRPAFMPARPDGPLRRIGAAKTAKAQLGGLLLRSLVELSRSRVRGLEVMPIDATGKT